MLDELFPPQPLHRAREADKTCKDIPCPPIICVGHSMGGAVAIRLAASKGQSKGLDRGQGKGQGHPNERATEKMAENITSTVEENKKSEECEAEVSGAWRRSLRGVVVVDVVEGSWKVGR